MKSIRITVHIQYKNRLIRRLKQLGYTDGIYENPNEDESSICSIFGEPSGKIYIVYRAVTRTEHAMYKEISFDSATIF